MAEKVEVRESKYKESKEISRQEYEQTKDVWFSNGWRIWEIDANKVIFVRERII